MSSSNMTERNIIIFDLDGTLANVSVRRSLADSAKAKVLGEVTHPYADKELVQQANEAWWHEWEGVSANIQYDRPSPVADILRGFHMLNRFHIVIFSGRNNRLHNVTLRWLDKHRIHFDDFFIRPANDMRPDEVLKNEMLMSKPEGWRRRVRVIFDDRNKVVKEWKKLALLPEHSFSVVQVADGDF